MMRFLKIRLDLQKQENIGWAHKGKTTRKPMRTHAGVEKVSPATRESRIKK